MSQFRLLEKSCNIDHIYQTRNEFCFTSYELIMNLGALSEFKCHAPTISAKTSVVTIDERLCITFKKCLWIGNVTEEWEWECV